MILTLLVLLPIVTLALTSLLDWVLTQREIKKYGYRVWRDERGP